MNKEDIRKVFFNTEYMKDIKENEEINKHNISTMKIFKMNGNYQCVLCKRKVDADNSYSNQGDRLICHSCYVDKFKNLTDARRWMNREF